MISPLVPAGCPSELRLDQLVVEELSAEAARETRAHVDGCDGCRTRLDAIERDRQRFVASAVPAPRRRIRYAAVGVAMLAAAAAIALLVARRPDDDTPGQRLKGSGEHLNVFVEHRGNVRSALPGERVAPGDKLQMTVTLRQARHVTLFGTDATGETTMYFDGRIEAGADVVLPNSIILDGTPGRESYVAMFCDAPATGCTSETFEVQK